MPKTLTVDLTKDDTFELRDISVEVIESTLKLLRTLRKIAVDAQQHEFDVHLGFTQRVLIRIATDHNAVVAKEQSDAESTAGTTTDERSPCPDGGGD
jgi:hypothetical protein